MNTFRPSDRYTCSTWVSCSMLSCASFFTSVFASPIPPDAIVQGVRVQDVWPTENIHGLEHPRVPHSILHIVVPH